MAHNTDFMLRYNFAKFVLKYIDYYGCASSDDRMRNGKIRKLGDFEEKIYFEHDCRGSLVPKNIPVHYGRLTANDAQDDECLYTSAGMEKLLKLFYRGRRHMARINTHHHMTTSYKGKNKLAPKRNYYISKLTKEFVNLVKDENFQETVKQIEGLTQVLGYMWHPTRPVESVGQYAIAKHASIHYILSTHAILPSAECFTPEDIQRIMHLPMEWIGALPRQEDTRCITKFIARFADLFTRKPIRNSEEPEDPLDRHARKCGQRLFLDIIRYACDGSIPPKRSKRSHHSSSRDKRDASVTESDAYDFEICPPLDWNDQLCRPHVKIVTLPPIEGPIEVVEHRFRRPLKDRHIQQDHFHFVPVDEESIAKEYNQLLASIKVTANKEPQGMQRFSKTRALHRGAAKVICPSMHDLRKREVESLPSQIAREQLLFDGLVAGLPHRVYGIHRLQAINASILAGLKPPRFDTSWLKDPTAVAQPSNWFANCWDPNRRIHVENLLRSTRVPIISPTRGPTLNAQRTERQSGSIPLRNTLIAQGETRVSSLKHLKEQKSSLFRRATRRSESHRRSTIPSSGRFDPISQKTTTYGGLSSSSLPEVMMKVSAARGRRSVELSNEVNDHSSLPPIFSTPKRTYQ